MAKGVHLGSFNGDTEGQGGAGMIQSQVPHTEVHRRVVGTIARDGRLSYPQEGQKNSDKTLPTSAWCRAPCLWETTLHTIYGECKV